MKKIFSFLLSPLFFFACMPEQEEFPEEEIQEEVIESLDFSSDSLGDDEVTMEAVEEKEKWGRHNRRELVDALMKEFLVYEENNDFFGAVGKHEKLLEEDSEDIFSHLALCYFQSRIGQQEKAIEHCDYVLKKDKRNDMAYAIKGMVFYEMRNCTHAFPELEKAKDLNDENAFTLYYTGLCYIYGGDKNVAHAYYEYAENIAPWYFPIQQSKALATRYIYGAETALREIELIIDKYPNYGRSYVNYFVILEDMEKYDEALNALDKGLSLRSTDWLLHYDRASFFLEKKNYKEALKSIDNAILYSPINISTKYLKAKILKDKGDLEAYETILEEAEENIAYLQEKWGEDYRFDYDRASYHLVSLDDVDTAIELYIKVSKKNPEFPAPIINSISLLVDNERYQEALDLAEEGLPLHGNNAFFLITYARALAGMKQYDKAEEIYEHIISLSPEYGNAYLIYANYYFRKNMTTKAIEVLQRGVDNSPYVLDYVKRNQDKDFARIKWREDFQALLK